MTSYIGLDEKWLNRNRRKTRLSLAAADFQNLTHKREKQQLISELYFPDFDIANTIDYIDEKRLASLIETLKRTDKENVIKLHEYRPSTAIGPGEALIYFLVSKAYLGGGTSAGMDLFDTRHRYEIKAARISNDNYATEFKIGTNVKLGDVIENITELAKRNKVPMTGAEIPWSSIQKLAKVAKKEFEEAESKFADLAYKNYFKGKEIIFLNNNRGSSRKGDLEAIKEVMPADIKIERITKSTGTNTIKPRVKL